MRCNLKGEVGGRPGVARSQRHQEVDAGGPGANARNYHEPALHFGLVECLATLESSLRKGERRGAEGARLGS